jgi:hypothetical protein
LEKLFDSSISADVACGYCFAKVVDEQGNTGIAVIFCTGYSFSDLKYWVFDLFKTKEDALAYLNANGWTSDGLGATVAREFDVLVIFRFCPSPSTGLRLGDVETARIELGWTTGNA